MVQEALKDPAADNVLTDGARVWISGAPAPGRTDLFRQLMPPAAAGGQPA